MATGATHTIDRVGIFSPKATEVDYTWDLVKLVL